MDRKIDVMLRDSLGKEFRFNSLENFKAFSKSEYEHWENARKYLTNVSGLIGQYCNSANTFKNSFDIISSWSDQLVSWDQHQFEDAFNSHVLRGLRHISDHWIWSGHVLIEPWLECHQNFGPLASTSFIQYFIGNQSIDTQSKREGWIGALLAYEFDLQDESVLTKRRKSEKKSISKVRDEIIELRDSLFTEVSESQEDLEQWNATTRSKAEKLYRVNKKMGERLSSRQQRHFANEIEGWRQRVDDLENLYKNKLRLDKPAEYWKSKAHSYFKHGMWWSAALGLVTIGGIAGFGYFFWLWLKAQELQLQLDTVQGAALFIAILSAYAFLIRSLSKMAFSSFHLQRDAEEREQLTHVYLALSHENQSIGEEARNIVLQALFSRADTGLLGGDSGPTMPGLHDFVKATQK